MCQNLVAAVIAINRDFMLVSPRAWFRLPTWIFAKGTLTEKKRVATMGN